MTALPRTGQVKEIGHIEDLSSPVIHKIAEAFLYSKAAFLSEGEPILSHSLVLPGLHAYTANNSSLLVLTNVWHVFRFLYWSI